jgi:anti-anti-sigma factor
MLAFTAGCKLDVQRGPDWLLVKIWVLDVDPDAPPPVAEQIWDLAQRHFTYRIVLELDRVRVLNSYMVGQIMELYRRLTEHDGVLRLCGLSEYNRRVLHGCDLDDRFPAYQCREEAVMGSGSDPRLPR